MEVLHAGYVTIAVGRATPLQQQNTVVLGEGGSQGASRRASPHDDVIVFRCWCRGEAAGFPETTVPHLDGIPSSCSSIKQEISTGEFWLPPSTKDISAAVLTQMLQVLDGNRKSALLVSIRSHTHSSHSRTI